MTKPLTRDEKIDCIETCKKFIFDMDVYTWTEAGQIKLVEISIGTDEDGEMPEMNIRDFFLEDIYPYEEYEKEDEWVEVFDDRLQTYYRKEWTKGTARFKKSWIIEKAKELGMVFK